MTRGLVFGLVIALMVLAGLLGTGIGDRFRAVSTPPEAGLDDRLPAAAPATRPQPDPDTSPSATDDTLTAATPARPAPSSGGPASGAPASPSIASTGTDRPIAGAASSNDPAMPARTTEPRPAAGGGPVAEGGPVAGQTGRASAEGRPAYAARATRDVTPPAITPGPAITGPLVRIPVPAPPKKAKKVPKRFRRIVVADARTLQAAGMTIRLAGIVAPGLDETCGRTRTWPCGRRARTALRKLIRARTIECAVTERISEAEIVSTCRVGRTDLAQWLAKQGWARPAAAAPAAVNKAAEEAKRKGRGLWRGTGE